MYHATGEELQHTLVSQLTSGSQLAIQRTIGLFSVSHFREPSSLWDSCYCTVLPTSCKSAASEHCTHAGSGDDRTQKAKSHTKPGTVRPGGSSNEAVTCHPDPRPGGLWLPVSTKDEHLHHPPVDQKAEGSVPASPSLHTLMRPCVFSPPWTWAEPLTSRPRECRPSGTVQKQDATAGDFLLGQC